MPDPSTTTPTSRCVVLIALDYVSDVAEAFGQARGVMLRPDYHDIVLQIKKACALYGLPTPSPTYAIASINTRDRPEGFLRVLREAEIEPIAEDFAFFTPSNPLRAMRGQPPMGAAPESAPEPSRGRQTTLPYLAFLLGRAGMQPDISSVIVVAGGFELGLPLRDLAANRDVVLCSWDGAFDGRWVSRGLVRKDERHAVSGIRMKMLDPNSSFFEVQEKGAVPEFVPRTSL